MDSSRHLRLASFKADMHDASLPFAQRVSAARAYERVKRQLKDKHLIRLRRQYMVADAASDKPGRMLIADRIETYMLRTYKRRI